MPAEFLKGLKKSQAEIYYNLSPEELTAHALGNGEAELHEPTGAML